MNILYDGWEITQEQQALSDGALMTDAAAARALIAYLDAKFGNPGCALCCQPAAANGVYCDECQPAMQRVEAKVMAEVARMPVDFARGLVDVANGAHYCADGIDWYAVEREEWR